MTTANAIKTVQGFALLMNSHHFTAKLFHSTLSHPATFKALTRGSMKTIFFSTTLQNDFLEASVRVLIGLSQTSFLSESIIVSQQKAFDCSKSERYQAI
jgi:hypothetical protein